MRFQERLPLTQELVDDLNKICNTAYSVQDLNPLRECVTDIEPGHQVCQNQCPVRLGCATIMGERRIGMLNVRGVPFDKLTAAIRYIKDGNGFPPEHAPPEPARSPLQAAKAVATAISPPAGFPENFDREQLLDLAQALKITRESIGKKRVPAIVEMIYDARPAWKSVAAFGAVTAASVGLPPGSDDDVISLDASGDVVLKSSKPVTPIVEEAPASVIEDEDDEEDADETEEDEESEDEVEEAISVVVPSPPVPMPMPRPIAAVMASVTEERVVVRAPVTTVPGNGHSAVDTVPIPTMEDVVDTLEYSFAEFSFGEDQIKDASAFVQKMLEEGRVLRVTVRVRGNGTN